MLEASTDNGKLVITPLNGRIDITFQPTDTQNARWAKGVWDVEITHPNGDVTRLAGGTVTLSKEVTR